MGNKIFLFCNNLKNMSDKQLVTLEKVEEGIYKLVLCEKTFTIPLCRAIHDKLTELEELCPEGPLCLITTSNHPKIYSAGLDFGFFVNEHLDDTHNALHEYNRLNGRMLSLGYPTIAAINGHCYAAGLMFAMAQDFRIQRQDLGQSCLSEINLGINIPPGMNNHIMQKIGDFYHKRLALLGQKFEPKDSLEAKIVDKLVPSDKLQEEALKMAREVREKGRHRKAYKAIKEVVYEKVIEDCLYRGVNVASRGFMPKPSL